MVEDTLVFVDNGFFKLVKKELELRFNSKFGLFSSLRNICTREKLNLKHLFFYTAPPYQSEVPNKDESILRRNYDTFSNMLKHKKKVTLREGRCQRLKIDGEYKYSQKGVDSWLVFDLARLKLNFPEIKKIILISSDSDFAPIIQEIKRLDEVEVILYTYFDRKRGSPFSLSNELLDVCNKWVKFKREDFKEVVLNE
jgi:uncharacterized LabA/DUF88 family protein